MRTIGEWAKARREAMALTQKAIAKKLEELGCSVSTKQTYSNKENGHRSFSPDEVAALLRIFDVPEAEQLRVWRLYGGGAGKVP